MSDTSQTDDIVVEVVTPPLTPEAIYSSPELEVQIGEPAPVEDPEKVTLRAQLAEATARTQQAQQAPVEAIAAGLADLGKALKPQQATPALIQQPGETPEAYKKRINDKFYDSPVDGIIEVLQTYKGAEDATAVRRNLAYSKTILEGSAEDKAFYAKHADEVEAQLGMLPQDTRATDPFAYRKALRIVQADHIDELVAARVGQQAAAPALVPTAPATPAAYTEHPTIASAPPKQRIVISSAKNAEIENYAATYGIGKDIAIELYRDNGWLK
jgi:hypothetical protein